MPEDTVESLREAMSAAIQSGDQSKIDGLAPRYEALHGEKEVDLSDGLSAGPKPTGEERDQTFYQESLAESDHELRADPDFGKDFDGNMKIVMNTALELFGNTPEGALLMERVAGAFFEAGGKMADMNRLLLKIGRRGK